MRVNVTRYAREASASATVELVLSVRGFKSDAVVNADPDDCQAPESEEEREVIGITIDGEDIPKPLVEKLAPYFDGMIYDLDLDD